MKDVYIIEGVRTPIGSYGGGLASLSSSDLGSVVLKEVVERSGISPDKIDEIIMGCGYQNGENAYAARFASIKAGLPHDIPALNVNRLCGSGLESISLVAKNIMLGINGLSIAGGLDSMSSAPYLFYEARWGKRMNDAKVIDGMVKVLTDPMLGYHMGRTAENLAEEFGISRQEQDQLAYESHQKAVKAQEEGRFDHEITPVEVKSKKKTVTVNADEGPRKETTLETLAKLPAIFKEGGTVTPGNASSINDAAAALILANEDKVNELDLKPKARLLGFGVSGVEPSRMGIGVVGASQKALENANLAIDDMDVLEINEAFAAQALACERSLEWDREKLNPNGGAIALGHPIGVTGSIITIKAISELKRTNQKYALVSLCIGGGQGIAAVVENIQ